MSAYHDRNEIEAVIKTSQNVTERKKTDHKAWRRANFDALTGIANRWLFIDRLEQTILETERSLGFFALLFIDLDHFKKTNELLGHKGGDRLLIQVAERLDNSVRAVDILARFGGDEFIMILKETGREGAKQAARALLESLERVFAIDDQQVHISANIGLACFPEHGMSVSELIHNADQAMYAAKERGGQQFQVYEASMVETESDHRL